MPSVCQAERMYRNIIDINKGLVVLITALMSTLYCGSSLATNNKIYDYRMLTKVPDIEQMQQFHLQQAQKKIQHHQLEHAWGDLVFILCHIPNHHTALQQIATIAPQLNRTAEMRQLFANALKAFPQDIFVSNLAKNNAINPP